MIRTLALISALAVYASAGLPQIAPDWNGVVIQALHMNQGGYTAQNGDVCCADEAPQCKVQTEFMASKQFYSVTLQKVKNANPDGSGVVQDFNSSVMKEFAVDASGNCQSYCPLDPRLAPLPPVGFGENATNEGKVMYNGRELTLIQWNETAPIFGTVQISKFYVDASNMSNAVPVAEIDEMGFFGQYPIHQNMTYSTFNPGKQDPSVFTVKGVENCPLDQSCQGGDDDYGPGYDDFPPSSGSTRVMIGQYISTYSSTEMAEIAFKIPRGQDLEKILSSVSQNVASHIRALAGQF